jgi:type I restriction enzyme S subunit
LSWSNVAVGEVFDVRAGNPAPQDEESFGDEGLPFVRAGSLAGLLNGQPECKLEKITLQSASRNKLSRFPAGTILFAKSGMSATKGYIYKLRSPAYVVSHLAALISSPKIDANYGRWVLETISPTSLIKDPAYPSIRLSDIAGLPIPLPPLDEQRRIAAILDQADELRRKRREALYWSERVSRALFVEMFGDWSRSDYEASTISIGSRLDFLTSGSRGWAEYYRESGDLFLRVQNVRDDELDLADVAYVAAPPTAEARRTLVQPGDVLLSITADLGRTATVPAGLGRTFINQHLAILRSSAFEPRFLSAALSSPAGKRAVMALNRQGVKAGLNFDDIRSLEVPDVSRDRQLLFATRAAEIDKIKARYKAGLKQLDALFVSLQHRAFRCEL